MSNSIFLFFTISDNVVHLPAIFFCILGVTHHQKGVKPHADRVIYLSLPVKFCEILFSSCPQSTSKNGLVLARHLYMMFRVDPSITFDICDMNVIARLTYAGFCKQLMVLD